MTTSISPTLLQLPLELRLQIYEACIPEVLHVNTCSSGQHDNDDDDDTNTVRPHSINQLPTTETLACPCAAVSTSAGRLPNPLLPLHLTCHAMNAELSALSHAPLRFPHRSMKQPRSLTLTCCSPTCLATYLQDASDTVVSRVQSIEVRLMMESCMAMTVFASVYVIQSQLKGVVERLRDVFVQMEKKKRVDQDGKTGCSRQVRRLRGVWRRDAACHTSFRTAGDDGADGTVVSRAEGLWLPMVLSLRITMEDEAAKLVSGSRTVLLSSSSSCCDQSAKQAAVMEWVFE